MSFFPYRHDIARYAFADTVRKYNEYNIQNIYEL